MPVLRVDPRNVYVKQHAVLHVNTKNCQKLSNGCWRYTMPRKKDVFLLELRVLQSRLPHTFPPVPATNLKFKAVDTFDHTHVFDIPLPPMGPAFNGLASEIRGWTGHNGEYSKNGSVTNDIDEADDGNAFAVLSNWPVSLEFRSIDNKFYFRRKNNATGVYLLETKKVEISGSLLSYLGFSEAQITQLASGMEPGDKDIVAEDFPDLWGNNNDVFVAFPNLPHANHLVWSEEELDNVYMILPVGTFGTEEITTYDQDRSHMHSVAWTESDAPHGSYIDIKFQKEDGTLLDFQGRSWVLVLQVTYTTP